MRKQYGKQERRHMSGGTEQLNNPGRRSTDHPANEAQEEARLEQDHCHQCGKPRSQWEPNDGAGFTINDETYCSEACVEKASEESNDEEDEDLGEPPTQII